MTARLYYARNSMVFLKSQELCVSDAVRDIILTIKCDYREDFMITSYLIVLFVSMLPIIELRGAIPVAQGLHIPPLQAYIICIIGNMIPVPFIFLFARKVLEWGKDKPVIGNAFQWCLNKGEKGGQALQEKAKNGLYVALLLFVGIPLPGTGAWTGMLAASFLNMDFKKSTAAVLGGVLLAGVIVSGVLGGIGGVISVFNSPAFIGM
ncbi:Uncharacterized membrane protein [Lachnospiraceae bacterium]|nr:Uncharacterized membrane protein [Lachnospiraceae bacterium]